MLLPSAFNCDTSHQPTNNHLQSALFVSPPCSPPTISTASQTTLGNIMSTCRSLQSLIAAPTPNDIIAPADAPSSLASLPTPPMAFAPLPMKLRLRTRATGSDHETIAARRKIARRVSPRGVNKRRRSIDDDFGRDDESEASSYDSDASPAQAQQQQRPQSQQLIEPLPVASEEAPRAPATPKRARIAPEQLPLGLERADFHDVHRFEVSSEAEAKQDCSVHSQPDCSLDWSVEDDRILVELVLEKLQLSKSEWQDCARNLGKDRQSVTRRWRSLILSGDIGVKTRSRRAKLHSTWR